MWTAIWAIANYRIRVPLWLPVVAVGGLLLWGWVDKTSAVRQAVNQLVAGGEIAAAKAERDLVLLNNRLLAERMTSVEKARDEIERGARDLEAKLADSEAAKQELNDAIEDLLATDPDDRPVGDPLCQRLLNCK